MRAKLRWWLIWLSIAAGLNILDATLAWLFDWNRPLWVVILIGCSFGFVSAMVAEWDEAHRDQDVSSS